ncbi:SPOR domain-containing protein [Maricaulis salignorans]|uniref:Sporulation related domain-containing protein n=1 Tax=Maricaulis salignorans TaxID=144026 RepID=A0A1G9VX36_9PROT|nr:SPOR domain-containing protein [Maricaulis salignorans]SDM76849.1 Sporulation related domain-containing protein [Maricaulis salignorans]
MKTLRLLLASMALVSGLSACTTTADAPEAMVSLPPVAETENARIAEITARELDRRARHEPDSLTAVAPQLRALALALAGPPPAAVQAAPGAQLMAGAPEAMLTAPSLWHGIHLASYRTMANSVSGWAELQARFPDLLADREARIEAVNIPDRGEFLRLQAGPYDTLAAARTACAAITRAGEYCLPVDFSGRPLADAGGDALH